MERIDANGNQPRPRGRHLAAGVIALLAGLLLGSEVATFALAMDWAATGVFDLSAVAGEILAAVGLAVAGVVGYWMARQAYRAERANRAETGQ
jgi:hypothetical protein